MPYTRVPRLALRRQTWGLSRRRRGRVSFRTGDEERRQPSPSCEAALNHDRTTTPCRPSSGNRHRDDSDFTWAPSCRRSRRQTLGIATRWCGTRPGTRGVKTGAPADTARSKGLSKVKQPYQKRRKKQDACYNAGSTFGVFFVFCLTGLLSFKFYPRRYRPYFVSPNFEK